jgi:hypothetical protein
VVVVKLSPVIAIKQILILSFLHKKCPPERHYLKTSPLNNYTELTVRQLFTAQTNKLVARLKEQFTFAAQVEMSIEIDPREIEMNLDKYLYNLGFNHLSIGVKVIDEKARVLIHNIYMSFDAYMKHHLIQQRFSRVI